VSFPHLGNLSGIASFVGYGLLCTVIGYLAPAPPRASEALGKGGRLRKNGRDACTV
jgi:uncharacterized membrane protein